MTALLQRSRKGLWIRARDVGQVLATPGLGNHRSLWLQLDDLSGLGDAVSNGRLACPSRLFVDRSSLVDPALALSPRTLVVGVNRETEPILRTLRAVPGVTLLMWHDPSPDLHSSVEHDVDDLRDALAGVEADGFVNIPPCLCDSRDVQWLSPLCLGVVGSEGLVELDPWVDHFIRLQYRVKSMRCSGCVREEGCQGIPISLVRNRGLGILTPVTQ